MKYVKEHINEKFELESDPIRDLGVGVFSKHNFNTTSEAVDFLFLILPSILKREVIPDDILEFIPNKERLLTSSFKWEYYWDIKHYCRKYLNINNIKQTFIGGGELYNELRVKLVKNGFPKDRNFTPLKNTYVNDPYKREIYEAFTEDSDPIQDMGIGLENKFQEIKQEMVKKYPWWSVPDYEIIAKIIREGTGNLSFDLALIEYSYKKRKADFYAAVQHSHLIIRDNEKESLAIYDKIKDLGYKYSKAQKESIFIYALSRNQMTLAEIIRNEGVNINSNRGSALESAVRTKDKAKIDYLLKHGAKVLPTPKNMAILKSAIKTKDRSIISLVFEKYLEETR